jgi:formylmethanofuran dehydrogenase subunit E
MKRSFEEDLERAVAFHGHLCGGQIIGTRISRAGMEYLGIEDPTKYRDLIAFVEADRCLADAVTIVADCHIGKRRLKWHDYGKMAASFLDTQTGKAVRVCAISEKRPRGGEDMVAFYQSIPDAELLRIQPVTIELAEDDLPGRPRHKTFCESCGEKILDAREVIVGGRVLCKPCAGEPAYYQQNKHEA